MGQFIYLYVIKERYRRAPNAIILAVFGLVAGVAIGVGVGGFIAYLGLGIIQSLNGQGMCGIRLTVASIIILNGMMSSA